MKNVGKKFEDNFRDSVSKDIFFYRFRDSSGTFYGGNNNLRFTPTNIADNLIFYNGCLFLNELKTHKGKSIPIDCILGNKKKNGKHTKEKQIVDMYEANKHENIYCNIIVFFSDVERCFSLDIENFVFFMQDNDRKSVPIEFFETLGEEMDVTKKKTNYHYDINKWLKIICKKE